MAKKKTSRKPVKKKAEPQEAAATKKAAAKKKAGGAKKAAAKKKTADTRPPLNLHTFVACDSITKEPSTGKVTLHGLFDAVTSDDFPVVFAHRFTLFARMYGEGEYSLDVCLEPPSGNVEKLAKHTVFCEPGSAAVLQMQVAGVSFPKPGVYKLHLKQDSQNVGPYCPIYATQRVKRQQ